MTTQANLCINIDNCNNVYLFNSFVNFYIYLDNYLCDNYVEGILSEIFEQY